MSMSSNQFDKNFKVNEFKAKMLVVRTHQEVD